MARKISKIFLTLILLFLFFPCINHASAQTLNTSSQCWSKANCMEKTENCEACFELHENLCGAGHGFCYAKPVPTTLSIALPGLGVVSDPAQYLSALYQWGVSITGILAGIMIMIGGLLYLTAGGSSERVSNAKSYISSALIGLVLALTSYFLLQTVNPALLSLKFPKVPLVSQALPPTVFCEDLTENSDITITPDVAGKTSCGDVGIPKSISGNSTTPETCAYGLCTNPEEGCQLYPQVLVSFGGPVAECQKVAGTRLDVDLANRRKTLSEAPGFFSNPAGYLASNEGKAEEEYANSLCISWTPHSQGGKIYKAYSTSGCDLINAGALNFLSAAVTLALPVSLISSGISSMSQSSGIGKVPGAAEAIGAGEQVGQVIRASVKHPAIALILGSIIASVGISEAVQCDVNSAMRGNAACALLTLDCNQITKCEDYPDAQIKAEKGPVALKDIDPRNYLGPGGNEIISEICNSNPCNLPINCESTKAAAVGVTLACTSPDWHKCSEDAHGSVYQGFTPGRQQKGQLCEKDADCQSGKCGGTPADIEELVPCYAAEPDRRNAYDASIGCIYGFSSTVYFTTDCGKSTDEYRRAAAFYKKETVPLKHCQ
jgi:hypothetical protein